MLEIHSFGIVPLKKEMQQWKVLLILHKEGNHWGFPKGRAEPNENHLESATRELKEETGLDVVKLLNQEPLIEKYEFQRHKERVVKTASYYTALVAGELQIQEEEIRDAKWLSLTDAMKQLTFKEAKRLLQKVIDRLGPMEQ